MFHTVSDSNDCLKLSLTRARDLSRELKAAETVVCSAPLFHHMARQSDAGGAKKHCVCFGIFLIMHFALNNYLSVILTLTQHACVQEKAAVPHPSLDSSTPVHG